jgi:hypothetical protein
MVETAAHLVGHVFLRLPVRQWVLSLPKRLRYFVRHDARTVTAVLKIFLRVVEPLQHQCRLSVLSGRWGNRQRRSAVDSKLTLADPRRRTAIGQNQTFKQSPQR